MRLFILMIIIFLEEKLENVIISIFILIEIKSVENGGKKYSFN